MQKVRNNKMVEKYIPAEGTRYPPGKPLIEVEVGSLPEREFRVMMIKDLRKTKEAETKKMHEIFNKELEDLKNREVQIH